jgi:hypothetical protein
MAAGIVFIGESGGGSGVRLERRAAARRDRAIHCLMQSED